MFRLARHVQSLVFLLTTAMVAAAQSPLTAGWTYQGFLRVDGVPVSEPANFEFTLWDAVSDGTLIAGPVAANGVPVEDGLFTVWLDFGSDAFNGEARWLEVRVNGTTLAPRQPLAAAPYALFAAGPWQTGTSSRLYYNAGNVGIGTSFPIDYRLHVNTNSGSAVYGRTTASGLTYGVHGRSESLGGIGVLGEASTATGNTRGVQGLSESTAGRGVSGIVSASSGTPRGVYGQAQAGDGAGVYGVNNAGAGGAPGVHGVSNAPFGSGVFGQGKFSGVNGQATGSVGAGVYGASSPGEFTNYGVWGFASESSIDYGVYCNGRFAATGTKSFRIDHPLDPGGRFLHHYCTEGPEPLNVYGGTVMTDDHGEARVVLPEYFEAINRDYRYSLTVVDDSDDDDFVQAKVAREIHDHEFKIRTSAPFTKVCWEVTAVRDDLWVRTHGAPAETDKTDRERGKYLHPELYGLPKDASIDRLPEFAQPPAAPPVAADR